jgi:hypothetical protein
MESYILKGSVLGMEVQWENYLLEGKYVEELTSKRVSSLRK